MSLPPSVTQYWMRAHKQAHAGQLDAEHERALIRRAQGGERAALEALTRSHMPLVLKVASQYHRASLQPQDLVSEGCLGLLEAIRRFDLEQPHRLTTYAKWWIRARIRAFAYDNRNLVRMPSTRNCRVARARLVPAERALTQRLGRLPNRIELAEALGVTEQEVATVTTALGRPEISLSQDAWGKSYEPCDDGPTPEHALSRRQEQRSVVSEVQSAVSKLAARDQMIIRAHFLTEDAPSMSDVSAQLGVSRQRVSQIVSRVCKQLRKDLEAVAS